MANEPITLKINKSDRKIYDEIIENSELKGKTKEVFLLSTVIGFKSGNRISIKGSKDNYVRTEYLNDEDRALMNSIAIYEMKDEEIIQDQKVVFDIIEEYAHVGIKILREMVFNKESGSFLKKFEAYLRGCLSPRW
mgnify:CR=1 FL=1